MRAAFFDAAGAFLQITNCNQVNQVKDKNLTLLTKVQSKSLTHSVHRVYVCIALHF